MARLHKHVRKVFVAIAGGIIILAGILMLVLPGPGIVAIAAGLFVLSLEFEWAERHYKRLEKEAKRGLARMQKIIKK